MGSRRPQSLLLEQGLRSNSSSVTFSLQVHRITRFNGDFLTAQFPMETCSSTKGRPYSFPKYSLSLESFVSSINLHSSKAHVLLKATTFLLNSLSFSDLPNPTVSLEFLLLPVFLPLKIFF